MHMLHVIACDYYCIISDHLILWIGSGPANQIAKIGGVDIQVARTSVSASVSLNKI